MVKLNKKGQTGGLVTGLIFGIAALVIVSIIAFVFIQTLTNADIIDTSTRVTTTVTNENSFINQTGKRLATFDQYRDDYTIVAIMNGTSKQTITSGNYTLDSLGILSNKSATNWENVSINYTYGTLTDIEKAQLEMSTNFTSGVDNVSAKLPTVLLVAAIVLILGILAVLVGVWQKMRMGGGSI